MSHLLSEETEGAEGQQTGGSKQDGWASLHIPDDLKTGLIDLGIHSAQDLVSLFPTKQLLLELLKDDKLKQIKLGIVDRQRFIKSVEDYAVKQQQQQQKVKKSNHRQSLSKSLQSMSMSVISEEESKVLDKLNNIMEKSKIYQHEIENEKLNILNQCKNIEQQFVENVSYLKQQIETFQRETIQKLELYKELKLSTLNEQEMALKQSQIKIEECYNAFNNNLSTMSNIKQRKGANIKIIQETLSEITFPSFMKTDDITEITSETAAVQQMIHIINNADDDEIGLYQKQLPPQKSIKINNVATNFGSKETKESICTVIPLQAGNSIELNIGIDITDGYDLDDDNKEDAIIYGLEVLTNDNIWKLILSKSSNDPSTSFKLEGLKNDHTYNIRIKYVYFQNKKKFTRYSDKITISLNKVNIVWNNQHHGKNVHFIEDHRFLCKKGDGDCSIVTDPMIISNNTFKRVVFAINIHKFGYKSCFGFIDYAKYPILMNGNWDKCFLHCPRKTNGAGIYGLSAKLKEKNVYCCMNGKFVKAIKLKKSKYSKGMIMEEDHFIFEIIFNYENKKGINICNVYLNDTKDNKCLLLSGSNKVTFNNIPSSIVPIYSHQDHGESDVSIKVINCQFC